MRRCSPVATLAIVHVAVFAVACARPAPSPSSASPVSSVPPASLAPAGGMASAASSAAAPPALASSTATTDGAAPAIPASGYPVGRDCSTADAFANEHRSLPPRERWQPIASRAQRIRLRVPPGVFTSTDGRGGLRLVGALKARELGPDGADRYFTIELQRVQRSIDALLADTGERSLVARTRAEGVFPDRTSRSFVDRPSEPVGSGASMRAIVGGHPAFIWVTGVEGYDTDHVLIDLGPDDTLIAEASWNSAIMGQPECYQRAVIGGVMDSLEVSGP